MVKADSVWRQTVSSLTVGPYPIILTAYKVSDISIFILMLVGDACLEWTTLKQGKHQRPKE